MAASGMIPMLDPEGNAGFVPAARAHDAVAAGGKVGFHIEAPDGTHGVVPAERLGDALKAGGRIHQVQQPTDADLQAIHDGNPVSQLAQAGHAANDAVTGMAKGAAKSFLQPAATLAEHLPFTNDNFQQGARAFSKETETHGLAEGAGATLEQIAEFAVGEGEAGAVAKGAGRMKQMAGVMEFLEKYPRLAKMLGTAVKQGAVGGAQAAAHGADAGTAAMAGAITGAGGAAIEGGAEALRGSIAREGTRVGAQRAEAAAVAEHGAVAKKAAEERAAVAESARGVKGHATAALETVAGKQTEAEQAAASAAEQARADAARVPAVKAAAKTEAEQAEATRLAAGQRAAHGVIAKTATAALPERGMSAAASAADTTHFRAAIDEVGGGRGFGELTPAEQSSVAQRAEAMKASAGARDFNEAAEKLRDGARPTFEKLDAATGGEYTKLRTQRNAAMRAKDFTKYGELNDKIDQLFQERTGALSADELGEAKDAWRKSKVLDDVHMAVEGSFTAPADVAERGAAQRTLRGPALQSKLNRLLLQSGDQVREVLGDAGVDNLYRLAEMTTPRKAKLTEQAARNVAAALEQAEKSKAAAATAGQAAERAAGAQAARQRLNKTLNEDLAEGARKTREAGAQQVAAAGERATSAAAARKALTPERGGAVTSAGRALVGRHGRGAMIGALAGTAVGHPMTGALVGAAAGEGWMKVVHAAAVNPRVGKLLSQAVNMGVSPKVYAPLIAQAVQAAQTQAPQEP